MISKRCGKPRTIRRAHMQLIALITVTLALVYTSILYRLYDDGLGDALEITLKMDAREFERRYATDPATPLPSTPQRQSFLGWDNVPEPWRVLFDEHEIGVLHEGHQNFEERKREHSYDELVAKNAHFVMMYPYPMQDGQILYMFADMEVALLSEAEALKIKDRLDFTIPLGLGVLLIVLLLANIFNQRIARSTNALSDWAVDLTLENLDKHPPDFRYDELNRIANQLQHSFQRIGKLLEREHQFLRNASHELRTPIAITSANLEYLKKVGTPTQLERPLERIHRANHTMKHLTETLLWLSRDNERQPDAQRVPLGLQIEQQREDLNYLLDGKDVAVNLALSDQMPDVEVPAAALQIVLHNLLRNAFQHTQEGTVEIEMQDGWLVISNQDSASLDGQHPDSIGLGLSLVKQLCKRMSWPFEIEMHPAGVSVRVLLPTATSSSN